MLVAAVVIPDTPLLVPGAAGRADVLPQVRAATLDAVSRALAAAPEHVVVLAGTPREPTVRTADDGLRPDLAPLGVPTDALPEPWRSGTHLPTEDEPAALGALAVLAHLGWPGPTTLITVATTTPPAPALTVADVTRVATASRAVLVVATDDQHRDAAPDPARTVWEQTRADLAPSLERTALSTGDHGIELWRDGER